MNKAKLLKVNNSPDDAAVYKRVMDSIVNLAKTQLNVDISDIHLGSYCGCDINYEVFEVNVVSQRMIVELMKQHIGMDNYYPRPSYNNRLYHDRRVIPEQLHLQYC